MSDRPTFSILHTSARPDAWRKVYDTWIGLAVRPEEVEYVLVHDARWGFPSIVPPSDWPLGPRHYSGLDKEVQNDRRMCYVDGVNLAAEHATGRVLIVVADDQFPCEGWDDQINEAITKVWPGPEFVARVNTGTPQEKERGITVMPIVSRARYERLGYLLYPGYESMFSDNDLTEHAQQDGCFIDLDTPVFPHRHAWFDAKNSVPFDAAYARQNRAEAYEVGARVLAERRASGFGSKLAVVPNNNHGVKSTGKNIAVCFPGEWFHSMWVAENALSLCCHLFTRFRNVWPTMPVVPCVYRARHIALEYVKKLPEKADYVLWIDDDNLLTPQHFEMLLNDLETHPELSGVVGWCWIYGDGRMSAGAFDERGSSVSFDYHKVMEAPGDLIPITGPDIHGWSGFPVVLHRGDVIEKIGPFPFRPLLNDAWTTGMSGEDTSFFTRATEKGLRFCMDRRVKVPHLKTGNPEPDWMMKENAAKNAGETKDAGHAAAKKFLGMARAIIGR